MIWLIIGILLSFPFALMKAVDEKYNGPSLKERNRRDRHRHHHHHYW